jgi:O-antigen/teichoic acid export membrane protein
VFEALTTFLIRACGAALAFALQVLLARIMSVNEYGLFVMVWVWTLALGSFASLGLAEMALRVLPRYALRMRTPQVAAFVSHGFRTTATVALSVSVAALVLLALVPMPENIRHIAVGICLVLPLLAMDFFLGGVSRAMGWVKLGTVTGYILRPSMAIAICALLWWLGISLTGLVVCAVIAMCLAATTVFLRFVIQRRLGAVSGKPTSSTLRKFWLKQSMPMLLASGLDDLLTYADVVLVGLLLSPTEAAIYFVASRVLMPASLVQYAFFYVAARRFSLALAERESERLGLNFWRATLATLLASATAIAVTLLLAPWLLQVFGGTFTSAMPLVIVLAVAQLARALATQAQEYLLVAGRANDVSLANAAGIAVLVIGSMAFAVAFGAIGIAWALTGALVLRALLLLKQSQSDLQVRTATA